jgi:hypothetical protein
MRTASLTTLTLLACGLAFAGRAENAVYAGGNLDGIAPQANVVVDLSGDKAMKLRSRGTDFSVPYAGVTKTDVSVPNASATDPSATSQAATNQAATKGKSSSSKSSKLTQLLTVEYTNAQGEAKTISLQLTKPAASNVMAAVRKHSPVTQVASNKKLAEKKELAQADPAKADQPQKTAKNSKKDKADNNPEVKTEVAKRNSDQVLSNKDGSWWGDSVWKTNRNKEKWEQQSTAVAQ